MLHLQAVQTFFLHVTEELVFFSNTWPCCSPDPRLLFKARGMVSRQCAARPSSSSCARPNPDTTSRRLSRQSRDTKKQDDDQVNPEPKRKTRGGGGSRTSEKPKRKSRGGKAKGKGRGKGKGKGSKKRKASVDEGDEEEDFLEEDEEDSILFEPFLLGMFFLIGDIS